MITINNLHTTIAYLLAPSQVPARLGDLYQVLKQSLDVAGVTVPQKKYIFEAIAANYPLLPKQGQKVCLATINAESLKSIITEAEQLYNTPELVITSHHLSKFPLLRRQNNEILYQNIIENIKQPLKFSHNLADKLCRRK